MIGACLVPLRLVLRHGARDRIRTGDLLVTNKMLCLLSYAGIPSCGLPLRAFPLMDGTYGNDGACGRDRTADPRFTRAVLCQLSYASVHGGRGRIRTSGPGKGRFYRPLRLATPPHAQGDDRVAHDVRHWQASSKLFPFFFSCAAGLACRSACRYRHAVSAAGVPWELAASRRAIAMSAVRRPARMRHASDEVGRDGACQILLAASCIRAFSLPCVHGHRHRRPRVSRCCLLMPCVSSSSCYSSYAVVKVRKRKSGTAGLSSSQRVPDSSRISTYVPSALLHGHPESVWGRGAIIIVHAQIAREDTREHAKRDSILPCLLLTLVFALGDGHRVFASSGSVLVGRCPLPFR